ncbi:MAG: ATP-binding cassette domain-containing protein [Patescibacteria group bacterium]
MIELRNVSKKIGKDKILDDISFTVKKGEVLGFLGPNGAGKTTTLKVITSFWPSDEGSVKIDDKDIAEYSMETRRKTGYLPEMVPLYDDMKVREYLKFVGEVRGLDKERIKQRIKEVSSSCGIKEVLNKSIDELSKGYRQRVGIAQAILHDPEVLILDEPTTGLDPNQIVEIRSLIKEIGKEKTVIFSTHILGEAGAACDRILIINRGRIVAEGTPEELVNRSGAKEVIYIKIKGYKEQVLNKLKEMKGVAEVNVKDQEGERTYGYEIRPEKDINIDLREHLMRAVPHWGWSILELSKKETSLEEVFRELTK